MQLSVFQSPGSDVCRQWDREVVEPSPKPFLCPPQGEGSTERVGTADPGWFWGSLSFSRYKGKVLTFPLPPVEKCHWKLFSMLVVWFSLIFPLDLVSACFSSSFRKQRVVSHCSCQECGREVPPFPCHTAHSYCREGCSQSGNAPVIHVGGPSGVSLGSHPVPGCLFVTKICVLFRGSQAQAGCWHSAAKFVSGLLSTDTNLGWG